MSRRRFSIGATIFGVVFIAATALAAYVWQTKYSDPASQLGAITAGIAVSGLLLSVLAVMAAAAAYIARIPRLSVEICFPLGLVNTHHLPITASPPPEQHLDNSDSRLLTATVRVLNASRYSAKNPTIIIRLVGMFHVEEWRNRGWTVVDRGSNAGVLALGWEGEFIHARKDLPQIDLTGVWTLIDQPCALHIELSADGYRPKPVIQPIALLQRPDWIAWAQSQTPA